MIVLDLKTNGILTKTEHSEMLQLIGRKVLKVDNKGHAIIITKGHGNLIPNLLKIKLCLPHQPHLEQTLLLATIVDNQATYPETVQIPPNVPFVD
ncbi:hypothetical protein [Klebsiella pneumoniae]|uniref:hypothetical protein n=1 Tax=Klebsiella pneumoniae TaxID=573 RepID=UPI001D0E7887|nr:hypothetical protein [Klebsiella pneumoniae]